MNAYGDVLLPRDVHAEEHLLDLGLAELLDLEVGPGLLRHESVSLLVERVQELPLRLLPLLRRLLLKPLEVLSELVLVDAPDHVLLLHLLLQVLVPRESHL